MVHQLAVEVPVLIKIIGVKSTSGITEYKSKPLKPAPSDMLPALLARHTPNNEWLGVENVGAQREEITHSKLGNRNLQVPFSGCWRSFLSDLFLIKSSDYICCAHMYKMYHFSCACMHIDTYIYIFTFTHIIYTYMMSFDYCKPNMLVLVVFSSEGWYFAPRRERSDAIFKLYIFVSLHSSKVSQKSSSHMKLSQR